MGVLGCMFSGGLEVFVKIPNIVRERNTHAVLSLSRLIRQVYTNIVGSPILFRPLYLVVGFCLTQIFTNQSLSSYFTIVVLGTLRGMPSWRIANIQLLVLLDEPPRRFTYGLFLFIFSRTSNMHGELTPSGSRK